MDEVIPFRRHGFFKALLWNADRLEEVCRDYLLEAEVPNLPGFCVVLGTTPRAIRQVFAQAHQEDNLEGLATPDALEILASTLLKIEADIVENGLLGGYNAHMSKFVLSAFHERTEKTETYTKSDNTVRVVLASHQPVSIEELREYERLETAIEEQRQIELAALGKDDPILEAKNLYDEDCFV